MSAIEKIIPYYKYEDYLQWEGKWEIIDGLPFAMAPSPVYNHQFIATNLSALFWNALPYYIIISPTTQEVEVYTLHEGQYQLKYKGRDFNAEFEFDECEVTIDFSKIW